MGCKIYNKGVHKTAQHGLVLCASGNLSYRKDEHQMLISSSGSWLSDITAEK
ncbi:MAG: hypothetical protein D3905_10235 [Candidatus Electrothrix sp. AS4_5]|nr:hypothetical protein [Candidatus Electrothrix gigas]MCI5190147.1 hypothetical protein [Candidatus Electrothrix gigas]